MAELTPLIFGIDYVDPQWLLGEFGTLFFWVCLVMIFIECGLFFPFLPGDSLLFALGIFVATGEIDVFPGGRELELAIALALLLAAAWAGNITGYEIGRGLGRRIGEHDGRLIKQKHLAQTARFFDRHGKKALVIGRFLAFVRTYVTVVAGVTRMDRRLFYVWSFIGGLAWVLSITMLGYVLGENVPWLQENIDYAIIAILAFTAVPITFEWWRKKRRGGSIDDVAVKAGVDDAGGSEAGNPLRPGVGS